MFHWRSKEGFLFKVRQFKIEEIFQSVHIIPFSIRYFCRALLFSDLFRSGKNVGYYIRPRLDIQFLYKNISTYKQKVFTKINHFLGKRFFLYRLNSIYFLEIDRLWKMCLILKKLEILFGLLLILDIILIE